MPLTTESSFQPPLHHGLSLNFELDILARLVGKKAARYHLSVFLKMPASIIIAFIRFGDLTQVLTLVQQALYP